VSSLANKTALFVFSAVLILVFMMTGQLVVAQVPTPAHVVVVIEENHGYSQIIGSSQAPYINTLATQGALFTSSYALTHPSQPNYLALFTGSTQGITDDSCPHTFASQTLETELISAGKTFAGYAEGLPSVGSEICTYGAYVRKHAPWTNFSKDVSKDDLPFTSFPTLFANLPTVSWVIPNLDDDMHDGTIQQADAWLQNHLLPFVIWAQKNNSLLIIQWDEDQGTTTNHVTTIFVGPMVKPGKYSEKINHYNILRAIEDMYKLPHLGSSASAKAITDVWK
jgi:phosphatidylinositol-3-phosphatase